ncbi:hypothetical protein UKS_13860 [Streptococcus sp. 116-D4]|nr:hypothetical protein UKS_13860 [Streptococcus sp. 116-D4]
MSNKDFSRKTMVSKEAVVFFYRMMANLEEKCLHFLIGLLNLCYNEYNKNVRNYFRKSLPALMEVCTC